MEGLHLKFKLSRYDKYFIKSIPVSLGKLASIDLEQVKTRSAIIFNEEAHLIQDQQSQRFQIMCSYMAAGYEELLSKGMAKEKILSLLGEVLIKDAGGYFVKWMTKIMLWIKRDKRKFIEQSTIQSKASYGNFLLMTEEREENRFTSVVHSCGFYDFFKRRGIPELTGIFCQWDTLWADEINKQNCGIRFDRPSTIADGDTTCRFEFNYSQQKR